MDNHQQHTLDVTAGWKKLLAELTPLAQHLSEYMPTEPGLQSEEDFCDFLFSQASMAYWGAVYADSQYPDFWPGGHGVFKSGATNPDDAYYFAPLDDNGIYRISGYRGSVHIINFQLCAGMAGHTGAVSWSPEEGGGSWGKNLGDYYADDLNIADNGWFEFILSRERPADYNGDWCELVAGTGWMLVRQRSLDWLNEVDGRFGIDRLDLPAIQPRYSAEQLQQRIANIVQWTENWAKLSMEWARRTINSCEVNQFTLFDLSSDAGWKPNIQQLPQCVFQLEPDEALLVETDIPETYSYWNFQVTDSWWRMLGGVHNQKSINAHQASIDSDGKFRFVVAAEDPGTPNWLDTQGYGYGLILGRWNNCSSYPLPQARKIKLQEVHNYMPEDTPVIDQATRETMVRAYKLGGQLRRRW